jgi:predicted transcriptional regulator
MRTTLDIDDDVLQAARSIAAAEGTNIGKALSELARLGLVPRSQSRTRSGFPVFDVEANASPITLELIKDALNRD